MANLFQMLTNGVNNLKNKAQNIGGAKGLTPYERLFGQQAPSTDSIDIPDLKGVDTSNPYYLENMGEEPVVNITASDSARTGGILNDIANGYRENRANPISLKNFGENQLADGRNKGAAFRIGEGLGSIGRFIDSPLGRGLLTGAAIGALGGNPSEMLAYGGTATMLNQGNRSKDALYRQQLEAEGIDTSGIRGYINDNTYKAMLEAKQLKDNSDYRNAYLEQQKTAQEEARADRALQRELTRRGQDLSYSTSMANIGLQREKMAQAYELAARRAGADKKTMQALTENNQTLADIDEGLRLINENPKSYSWFKGKVGADIANRIDPKGVGTRTQIDNITAIYRKWLTGAQMSDQERKAYERFLPAPSDNADIVKAKLQGMKNSIQRKNDVMMSGYQMGGAQSIDNDPLGIL